MNSVLDEIILDLRGLGLCSGDTVLVHSSLSALGYVEGGADTVIDALAACLEDGTLLMPALTYRDVTPERNRFSVTETKCCVGAIPERFRQRGALRSVHPTHSVCAAGVRAELLTKWHHMDRTPVGGNSPFRLLPLVGGKILMLGCGLGPNTFMHGVEEVVGAPYTLKNDYVEFEIINNLGCSERIMHRCHDFNGVEQRYERVAGLLDIVCGRVLGASAFLLDADRLWHAAFEAFMRDRYYFVDCSGLEA